MVAVALDLLLLTMCAASADAVGEALDVVDAAHSALEEGLERC